MTFLLMRIELENLYESTYDTDEITAEHCMHAWERKREKNMKRKKKEKERKKEKDMKKKKARKRKNERKNKKRWAFLYL